MISAAAIRTRDDKVWTVPRPGKHPGVFRAIEEALKIGDGDAELERWHDYTRGCVQGFVRDDGAFLDRVQALEHAIACGQLPPGYELTGPVLTSEDLW